MSNKPKKSPSTELQFIRQIIPFCYSISLKIEKTVHVLFIILSAFLLSPLLYFFCSSFISHCSLSMKTIFPQEANTTLARQSSVDHRHCLQICNCHHLHSKIYNYRRTFIGFDLQQQIGSKPITPITKHSVDP